MRKILLALLVFAAALAITPSALADSFGYTATGLRAGSSFKFDSGRTGFSNVAIGNGVERDAFNAGWAGGSYMPPNRAVFDSLIYPEAAVYGPQDRGAVLVDISGNDLVLLSGSSDHDVSRNAHFYYADKGGYHVSNESPKGGIINTVVETTALAVTPEPGSLFLLGTGLLGMALVLFWTSAKRPTNGSRS